jgi:hypothetical protein
LWDVRGKNSFESVTLPQNFTKTIFAKFLKFIGVATSGVLVKTMQTGGSHMQNANNWRNFATK